MCSFISNPNSIIFTSERLNARLYIYSSQLTLIGTNRHSTQNVVIHDLKMRYMLCSTVNYTVCSLKSNSDLMIITPGRGRARLYIYSSNLTLIGSNN
jgi:hypothetical protein